MDKQQVTATPRPAHEEKMADAKALNIRKALCGQFSSFYQIKKDE